MTKSGKTFSMELNFAVNPHPPPTRSSRSIWFHTMFSAEPGMQSLRRKPTTRPSMGGGNIGNNKEINFFRGGPAKSKTTFYTVRCRTGIITIHLSGSCRIRYRVFPVKTPAFVITIQWVVNPLCTYTAYCVPYSWLLAN
jgi:hypothetical protein